MQDPFKNAYLAGHLPMTKAVIKAMDAIQIILKDKGVLVNNFVLTGASKRGWAVWLAAISDERVSAIIPIVIDILNVQKNINLICSSYGGICPPAFRDYADEGITNYLQSQEFSKLMEIEDPYSYINNKKYEPRFKIPKYIINSSGDDFYVADSSSLYFKSLPGEKFIRFLPEGMHYIAGNPISNYIGNIKTLNDEISDFFYFHLNNSNLPLVSWSFEDDIIEVNSSIAPIKITLWQAHNKKIKDFRCINSYEKSNLYWKIGLIYLYETFGLKEPICNTEFKPKELQINCDKDCNFKIDTIVRNSGWHASFVELIYNINGKNFTVTTEMLVTKKDN